MNKVYFASSKLIQTKERKKFLDTNRKKLEECLSILKILKIKYSLEQWRKEGLGNNTLNYSSQKILNKSTSNTLEEREVKSIIKFFQGFLNNNDEVNYNGDLLVDFMYQLSNEFYDNYYEDLLEYFRYGNDKQREEMSSVNKKELKESNNLSYPRNPLLPNRVISLSNYHCEVDQEHKFFISNRTKRNYVEAHHLIPLAYHKDFNTSLDVLGNMVSLCVICHKKLHHGEFDEKRDILISLYNRKKDDLYKDGLDIEFEDLLKYYQVKVYEEW
ncbi:HNH endonuclease [Lysinibacillus odysseyi]|uniref:HNH endonuclease n=1 Tax=Lysinibacillus odysseyi TaxID=202611 RepID=UPI00069187BD|nr:hypothetical protein [Lysinibacillus odysseyi]